MTPETAVPLYAWPDATLPLQWGPNREGPRPYMPQIGERVRVTINGLGTGRAFGYFTEHGYLGVMVELDEPPAWFWKQTGSHIAHVFGTEIAKHDD